MYTYTLYVIVQYAQKNSNIISTFENKINIVNNKYINKP